MTAHTDPHDPQERRGAPDGSVAGERSQPKTTDISSGKMDRPARTYVTGPVTRWVRIAALCLGGLGAIAVLAGYASLPETIPTHFDISGRADAWGHKSSVFVLVAIFVPIIGGMAWLSHHPRIFNYPVVITEVNAQAVYRTGEQMIVWVTAGCAVLFCGIVLSVVLNLGSGLVVGAGIALVVGAIVVGIGRLLRSSHRIDVSPH